jgi:hypothetical protein
MRLISVGAGSKDDARENKCPGLLAASLLYCFAASTSWGILLIAFLITRLVFCRYDICRDNSIGSKCFSQQRQTVFVPSVADLILFF